MKTSENYIKFVYYIWSKFYDSFIDKPFEFNRNKVIKKLNIKKGNKILEIGVGTGLNIPYYPKNCFVIGIDISKSMLEKAKNKKSKCKIQLKIENAEKTSYQNNSFDKVIATYVIRVTPNIKKVLNEISRVIKNNEIFVIVDEFKTNNKILNLLDYIKVFLGWGRDYKIEELIKNTPWKIIFNKKLKAPLNTRLVILKNIK